jgi:hypothetical protein
MTRIEQINADKINLLLQIRENPPDPLNLRSILKN